jgi:hypothetical protein
MKQRIFGWITVLLGVVMALAAIEVTAIVWLYIEDGHYTPAAELYERTQNTYVRDLTKGACRYVDTLFPHPYVAFVHHGNPPCGLENVNNVGLFNDDFPTIKRADRYTIILVGGSVASQMAQNAPSPPAPKYLEEELNKNYVSPNGKPFLVLNGGDGAWKEPQQFILFSMYAGSVDGVVALDGFNEYYSFWPGTEERLERPDSNFLEVNPFVADENFGDAAIGWVIGRVAGVLAQNPVLGHSHAAYMIIRGIEAVAKSKDVFKSTKKTTLRSLFSMPEDIRKDHDLEFAVQLALYQKYERGIEAVAKDNGVKSIYFLQPAPAYGKTLTEEEKKDAGDLSYGELYRRIVAGMMTLKDKGLPIFDLGDILANDKERLYADHIHFIRDPKTGESQGYRIMAARMAEKIAETWGLHKKQ